MSGQVQAKWTVMIYANGNNELQPEMWQCKQAAEKVGSNQEVKVVLQISQEKSELAAFLRTYTQLPVCNRKWMGARSLDEVATFISIMNPSLSKDSKQRILDRLYQYKKWRPDYRR